MLFALIHLLAGTVLAGVLIIVVVSVPALYDLGMQTIPVAVLAGFALAIPVAYLIARAIKGSTAGGGPNPGTP